MSMTVGPYVFGDHRRHLWVAENASLTDKLTHFLPRLRAAIPNLTDLELPPTATNAHVQQVKAAGFFAHMYEVAHGRTPEAFADAAMANHSRIKAGGLELNFEGSAVEQMGLNLYITRTLKRVRAKKPNLPVQANCVPYKAGMVPVVLINEDPKLTVCFQGYLGNMDKLVSSEFLLRDALQWGLRLEKVTVMEAVMCSPAPGRPREITLSETRNRGAYYIDDLLLDAGLLP
jgi:hypothetical protein